MKETPDCIKKIQNRLGLSSATCIIKEGKEYWELGEVRNGVPAPIGLPVIYNVTDGVASELSSNEAFRILAE